MEHLDQFLTQKVKYFCNFGIIWQNFFHNLLAVKLSMYRKIKSQIFPDFLTIISTLKFKNMISLTKKRLQGTVLGLNSKIRKFYSMSVSIFRWISEPSFMFVKSVLFHLEKFPGWKMPKKSYRAHRRDLISTHPAVLLFLPSNISGVLRDTFILKVYWRRAFPVLTLKLTP